MADLEKNMGETVESVEGPTVDELTLMLKRVQADFENYRKQQDKRMEDFRFILKRENLTKILPVIDNFSLALKNTSNPGEFTKGIELIYAQFQDFLKDNGVCIVSYDAYNPELHEALMKVDNESKENTILEVFQDGYMLDGRVLRPAKVKVSNGDKNE
jgi:molecular chaperone GrpE